MAMAAHLEAGTGSCIGDWAAAELRWQRWSEGRASWLELVGSSPQATLYHRESWLQLLSRAYGLSLWLATLHHDGAPAAGCVFARSALAGRYVALSFSDTCPPLARQPQAARELMAVLVAQNPSRAYEVRGVGGVERWQTVECFADWRLNLDQPLAKLERGLAINFRRNLRRALSQPIGIERGNSVHLLARFYGLQVQSRRRLGLPPQPWRFFNLAREIFAPQENFEVWIAREGGVDVAGAVFVRDRDVIYYKWGARRPQHRSCANHLLFWNAIEEFSHRAHILDLGRADIRNQGLSRFKAELGAAATMLPLCFYPRAPAQVSAEVLTGVPAILSRIWRRMPLWATKMAGCVLYRFMG